MTIADTPTGPRPDTDELITEPLRDVVDPDAFTPRLLALLSNALVWRESHELRRRFGLGTNDWRIISVLALRPGACASEVSEFIGVNKAVVSKGVATLTARGLIALLDGPRGSRAMYLTETGARMHDDMLPISMSGQDIIHESLTAGQIADLNELLRTMIARVRAAQDRDDQADA